MINNIILDTDSYKASHSFQYPPNTTKIYSYIESRGGRFDRTLFFGLQMYLKEYLCTRITIQMVNEAEDFYKMHGVPFDRKGWERIVYVHGGRLPLKIKAVREGMVIPTHNVLVTVENTDPLLPWITSYFETALLRAVWYPTTVATLSWHAKQIIRAGLTKTSDDPEAGLPFKLHDFGARGVSSRESAAVGGAAHLVNFMGSDTISGILAAKKYYGAEMAGFSIPAAEHSTITSWGKDGETAAYFNMLSQFAKPGSLVAVVSDSYDLWNAVGNIWGGTLKQMVRMGGATVVIRPDSGDPTVVPAQTIELLGNKFGWTMNKKNYRVLPSCVRVIQGDGITIESLPNIIDNIVARGWSIDNIAFGMGGGLLQQVNRDTQKFAMKCSAANIDGEWRDVFKDPITDPGKTSKKGRLILTRETGKWETMNEGCGFDYGNVLRTVFLDGELVVDQTFDQIRQESNNFFD